MIHSTASIAQKSTENEQGGRKDPEHVSVAFLYYVEKGRREHKNAAK